MREQKTVLCLEEKYSEKYEPVSVQFGRSYSGTGQPPARRASAFASSRALYAEKSRMSIAYPSIGMSTIIQKMPNTESRGLESFCLSTKRS